MNHNQPHRGVTAGQPGGGSPWEQRWPQPIGVSMGKRTLTPVAFWVTALVVLMLALGTVAVVLLTKRDTSPPATMNAIADDIASWKGVRIRFAASGAGFDVTNDRDGNSKGSIDVPGAGSVPASHSEFATIHNKSLIRTDGGPWMKSPIASQNPGLTTENGPEAFANRLRRVKTWTEEAGRMLDGHQVRVISSPESPVKYLVSTDSNPRLLGWTIPSPQINDEPARVEQADPGTLAEIKALEPIAANIPG